MNILQQEVELHEQLISQLQKESEGFGRLRSSELLKLQGEKSRCVRATARLEKERIQFVEKLADSWNTKSKELTLSVIIDRTEDEFSKSLQQCFERLKSLVTEIRKIADENSLQASGRLKSVESSIRFMSQLQNSPPTYSDAGRLQNGTSTMSRTEA
ncbi:MAG: flagellar protein FlgN [SAR324 cluster bacterium]|nr:flagellar protein FlgN [SAR324 cluster bacterium]